LTNPTLPPMFRTALRAAVRDSAAVWPMPLRVHLFAHGGVWQRHSTNPTHSSDMHTVLPLLLSSLVFLCIRVFVRALCLCCVLLHYQDARLLSFLTLCVLRALFSQQCRQLGVGPTAAAGRQGTKATGASTRCAHGNEEKEQRARNQAGSTRPRDGHGAEEEKGSRDTRAIGTSRQALCQGRSLG
jgi:hypothetical protein